MKKSFEEKHRKPGKPAKVITMAEFLKKRIKRVILAKKTGRVFQHA